jgi:hypothetical protein
MDPHAVLRETLTRIDRFEFRDPLERSYEALRAAAEFVDGNLPPSLRGLTSPLHALINAVSDTLKGAQPDMLRPRRRGKGAPKDLSFSSVQGVLASLLEVLIRAGAPRDSAARSIATQAAAHKILDRKGQRVTAKNIIAWRARANDDLPSAGTAAFKTVAHPHVTDQKAAERYVQGALRSLADSGHGRDRNSE